MTIYIFPRSRCKLCTKCQNHFMVHFGSLSHCRGNRFNTLADTCFIRGHFNAAHFRTQKDLIITLCIYIKYQELYCFYEKANISTNWQQFQRYLVFSIYKKLSEQSLIFHSVRLETFPSSCAVWRLKGTYLEDFLEDKPGELQAPSLAL